jgi:hypothetical protein
LVAPVVAVVAQVQLAVAQVAQLVLAAVELAVVLTQQATTAAQILVVAVVEQVRKVKLAATAVQA